MKMIVAIIRPEKLEAVQQALERARRLPDDRQRRARLRPAARLHRGVSRHRVPGAPAAQAQAGDRRQRRLRRGRPSRPSSTPPAPATPARSATARSSSCRWRTASASAPANAAARPSAPKSRSGKSQNPQSKIRSQTVPLPYKILLETSMVMTPKEVLTLIREKEVKAVDLRFMDFPGMWQHFTIPAETLEEAVFRKASASTAPPSAAGRRSTNPTCS